MQASVVASPAQTDAIGGQLGVTVTGVTNTLFRVAGKDLQVNTIECGDEREATTVYEAIRTTKPNPAYCLRHGATVVEFVCPDIRLVRMAPYSLGLAPWEATYNVTFEMAPVEDCDYMVTNTLFNLILEHKAQPANETTAAEIAAKSQSLRCGNSLTLRALGADGQAVTYAFTPAPDAQTRERDCTRSVFPELPRYAGIPYVTVAAEITVRAFNCTPTDRKPDEALLSPTPFWPSDDAQMKRLASEITAGATSAEQKVQAVLDWLMPGAHLKYGGPVVGSRYGVKQALQQGFGRCWDFSDLFVTLCRAAGIPCRQVAGWLYEQSGHVWAEVLVEGKGWQQVDPTAGMACGSDYIPWLTTETGAMPILYLSTPVIQPIGGEAP